MVALGSGAALFAACGAVTDLDRRADSSLSTGADPGFEAYVTGSGLDVGTTGGDRAVYLAGGGRDDEAGMRWLLARGGTTASGGYGDVVVLRTSGSAGYNEFLDRLGANSVTTFVIRTVEGANSPNVARAIGRAEVIFLAGGDQSTYVNRWAGTALQSAVNARLAAGAAVGGTSAGLNVLGEYIYSAQTVSTTSAMALANPYDPSITFAPKLFDVPLLRNTIAEPHFVVRARMGRFYTFLTRLQADGTAPAPRGLAVDEDGGVGVTANGQARVFGAGNGAYLLTTTAATIGPLSAPLTASPMGVRHVPVGGTFNATSWSAAGVPYTVVVNAGILTASTGTIY
jgi:cyanophycinase